MGRESRRLKQFHKQRAEPLPEVQPVEGVAFLPMASDHGPGVGVVFMAGGRESPAFLLPKGCDWPAIGGQLIGAGTLVEVLTSLDEQEEPEPETTERGDCSGCGQPIFGDLVAAGLCKACAD